MLRVIRKLEHNGETLTTVNDEQGLFMEHVDSMKQLAEELLDIPDNSKIFYEESHKMIPEI